MSERAELWPRPLAALRRFVQRRPRGPRGLVLLYHRVACAGRDPQRLAVSPAHFADHMAFLERHAVPLPLPELLARAGHGRLPAGAVAVTFDDGYADTLHHALPALERHGVAASVFVTTAAVVGHREFWWDELEQLLLGVDASGEADIAWHVEDDVAPSPSHERYRRLCHRFRVLDAPARDIAIGQLASASGRVPSMRPSHRPLSPEEVAALASHPLIEVGAHTVSHCALAALTPDRRRSEIGECRRQLEAWTDRRVTGLAYPFGGRAEVGRASRQHARDAGLASACTTEPGLVDGRTDPWRLPRMIVRDWTADEFAARWRQWVA